MAASGIKNGETTNAIPQWTNSCSSSPSDSPNCPSPTTSSSPVQSPTSVTYYPDGPSLSLLWSKEPLSGQSLYLGGEVGVDGKIYCIPGNAKRVLVIDPATDSVAPMGPELPGKFKWLRGVRHRDVIYGLPCHAPSVLRIHVPTKQVTTLPITYSDFYTNEEEAKTQEKMEWKYHGGTACPLDGCIYAIPQSAWHVLKIDPSTDQCELVESPPMVGRYKWYGGVVGKTDGAIYGIPHNSNSVLRIDPSVTDRHSSIVSLHGDYGTGGHKWHGAAVAPNGTIVSVPANADTVLCVVPARPEPTLFELQSDDIQTGHHRSDGKYKYLGAMTGTDGKVYCFPSGAERVLQVDAETKTAKAVGPNLYKSSMERMLQNKWQNGLTSAREQCVYAIPLSAETVLKIDTLSETPRVTTWRLPPPCSGLAKWEGGVLADNGVMYCMPNNHKAVLRIAQSHPPDTSSRDVRSSNGTTVSLKYRSGIAALRSSAHKVSYSLKHRKHDPRPKKRDGKESHTTVFPAVLREEMIFSYDKLNYDFHGVVAKLLEKCDADLVGSFPDTESRRLESFYVPPKTLDRSSYGGHIESAQEYLSDFVASDVEFLALFDRFVVQMILPHLKHRLIVAGVIASDSTDTTFYYQRPPTIRLQPGPGRSTVKAHSDAEYGHQHGELNYWVPLTDRNLTGVDLWSESSEMKGDYHRLPASYGEVISWHGSSCRHYVNANHSNYTRVSFDFRVGIENFFDPDWQMRGTMNDHDRRAFRI